MTIKRIAAALATAACVTLVAVVPAVAGPKAAPEATRPDAPGRPAASGMTDVSFCVDDTALNFKRMVVEEWPADKAAQLPVPGLLVIDEKDVWLTAAVEHPIGEGVCNNLPKRVLTDEPLPPTDGPDENEGPDPNDPIEPTILDLADGWATDVAYFTGQGSTVACAISPDEVRCDIPMEYTGTLPEASEACPGDGLDWVTYVRLADGEASYGCATDPASLPYEGEFTRWVEAFGIGGYVPSAYYGDAQVASLEYGAGLRWGDFQCVNCEDTVACTNTATGHGMGLSPRTIVTR